jgi:hypothetical protein
MPCRCKICCPRHCKAGFFNRRSKQTLMRLNLRVAEEMWGSGSRRAIKLKPQPGIFLACATETEAAFVLGYAWKLIFEIGSPR